MLRSGLSINDLAQACAHSANAAEWEEFLRRVTPLATMVVMRVARLWMNGSALPAIDDIVQEILIKLCEQERRVLREFVPRGEDSFLGLLRTISASAANDYFRRLHSAKRGGKVVTTSSSGDGVPALESVNGNALGIQKSVLFSQLDRRLESAPGFDVERDRNLFWLYYL